MAQAPQPAVVVEALGAGRDRVAEAPAPRRRGRRSPARSGPRRPRRSPGRRGRRSARRARAPRVHPGRLASRSPWAKVIAEKVSRVRIARGRRLVGAQRALGEPPSGEEVAAQPPVQPERPAEPAGQVALAQGQRRLERGLEVALLPGRSSRAPRPPRRAGRPARCSRRGRGSTARAASRASRASSPSPSFARAKCSTGSSWPYRPSGCTCTSDWATRFSSAVEDVAAGHRLGRLEGEAAGEHAQPAEQALLGGVEQVVAPVEGGGDRALARGQVARRRRWPWPPPGGTSGAAGLSSRTLAAASSSASGMPASRTQSRGDVGRVLLVEVEAGRDRPGALDEQGTGGRTPRPPPRAAAPLRHGERLHRVLVLAAEPQRAPGWSRAGPRPGSARAARRARPRRRAGARGCRRRAAAGSRAAPPATTSAASRPSTPTSPTARPTAGTTSDGSATAASGTHATPSGKPRRRAAGDLDGQPRLAHPADAGERHEPDAAIGSAAGQHLDLVVAAEQRRGRHRQRRSVCSPPTAAVRRGVGVAGARLPARAPRRAARPARSSVSPSAVGQRPHRVRVGPGAGAALQRADRVRRQPGPLGQLLLRQPGPPRAGVRRSSANDASGRGAGTGRW